MTADRRVLVCDDEPQILRALRVVLREAGFDAVPAATAEEALDRAAVRPPDAAIVDLVLPDGDGVEVTRRLREWSEMPIIVLSAVGDEAEKVRALEAGADDYVTKPFGPRELVARLEAVLRRANRPAAEPTLHANGLEIDLAARIVRVEGEQVHLTPIEFDLLPRLPATTDGCSPTARCSSRSGGRNTRTTPRCSAHTSQTCGARSVRTTCTRTRASAIGSADPAARPNTERNGASPATNDLHRRPSPQ